ncbi:uncharacterized protein LOC111263213 isoform X2 [Varroa jacobsoni]|uniref:uncharacterized protein LOC111263213 isoform X2 n=1 Tax=Varroa jacobsoni TaxID=62625 RepID=UPI000BF6863B|nr:uncharacterized protein LOC111263213 isoform X2 [Varroa jacobsoni]
MDYLSGFALQAQIYVSVVGSQCETICTLLNMLYKQELYFLGQCYPREEFSVLSFARDKFEKMRATLPSVLGYLSFCVTGATVVAALISTNSRRSLYVCPRTLFTAAACTHGEKIEDFHHHYVSVPAQQTYVLLSCALKIQCGLLTYRPYTYGTNWWTFTGRLWDFVKKLYLYMTQLDVKTLTIGLR